MEYRYPGTRYKEMQYFDTAKHLPYDLEGKGLLNKLLPSYVYNTQNIHTKGLIQFIENAAMFLFRYVEELRNFRNWSRRAH